MPVTPAQNATASTKAPTTVALPLSAAKTDTIAITLTQAPPPVQPFWENVSFVVGICTFLGVVLSLCFAHVRMRQELTAANDRAELDRTQTAEEAVLNREHDAKLAHQERVTIARRAAYLEVCEQVIKTQEFIGQISMMNPNKFEPSEATSGLVKAVAKMSILGEMETVLLSRKLLNRLMVVLFAALPKAFPIQERVDAAEQSQQVVEIANTELKRILMTMKNIVDNTPEEQVNFQALQKEFDVQMERSKMANDRAIQLHSEINLMRKTLNDETLGDLIAVSGCVDEMVHLIRTELGLFSSLDQLRDSSKSSHDLAKDVIAKLHALMVGPPKE